MSVFQLLQYSRVTQAFRTKTKQRKTTPGCYSMPTGGTWLYKSFPEARRAGDHFYLVFLHHFPLPIRHIRGRVTFLNNKPEHVSPLPATFSGSLITLKRIRSSWPSKIRPGMFLQPALLGRPQCFLWEVLCASHLNQPSSPSPAPFSITCLPNSLVYFLFGIYCSLKLLPNAVHVPNTLWGATSEYGAEKGLLQDHARRKWAHVLPKPQTLEGFQQSSFKNQEREGGCKVCDQLVYDSLIGWWWGKRVVNIICL